MNQNFTLQELTDFTINEQALMESIGLVEEKVESPSIQTIQNILAYSQMLSVRKSAIMGNIELLLN